MLDLVAPARVEVQIALQSVWDPLGLVNSAYPCKMDLSCWLGRHIRMAQQSVSDSHSRMRLNLLSVALIS